MLKKVGVTVLYVGILVSGLVGADEQNKIRYANITKRKEFIFADQAFGQFRVSSGKPLLIKFDPTEMKLDVITCKLGKTQEQGNNFEAAALDVLRFTHLDVNTNKKEDYVCAGCRETVLEKCLEGFLKTIHLDPLSTYEGTLLIDEYRECLPMKWTFKNIEAFHQVKDYLQQKFAAFAIDPQAGDQKPLLLLSIKQGLQALETSDIEFLTKYYSLVDPEDEATKLFFKDFQEAINEAFNDTRDAKDIKESIGKQIMRLTEKQIGGSLKIRDIVLVAIVTLTVKKIGGIIGSAPSKLKKFIKKTEPKPEPKPALGTKDNPIYTITVAPICTGAPLCCSSELAL